MKEFVMSIPPWFWMIIILMIVSPISFSIFKNGIKAKFKNKVLGEAEIVADDEKTEEKFPTEEVKKVNSK